MSARARLKTPLRAAPAVPKVARFATLFVLLWIGLLAIETRMSAVDRSVRVGTAACVSTLLSPTTALRQASETRLEWGSTAIEIDSECTPILPTLVLWAAMLAFPAPLTRKVLGGLVGAIVLWVFNVLRIAILALVLHGWPRAFEFVHVLLWQTATLLVVLGLFVGWARTVGPPNPRAGT